MAGYMSDSGVGDYELGVEGARYNAFIWKQSVSGSDVDRWPRVILAHGAAHSFACEVLAGRFGCSFGSGSFGFGFPALKLDFNALVNAFGRL
jgi:hypothetical protein